MISLVFFGSFLHYSVRTLDILNSDQNFQVSAVITTPPRPGNKLVVTKTAVHQYALDHHLPVFPLENLDTIPPQISPPDFIVVSGYGRLIPHHWLQFPRVMALNLHQSLLPEYAGRFPAEWAILRGETITGVTLISMTDKFDQGGILAQESISIDPHDTRESLYTRLYQLSGRLAVRCLPLIINHTLTPVLPQTTGFYARQITREDGFLSWSNFCDSLLRSDPELDRKLRAFTPWPGVWTITPSSQRLKLLSLQPITVQIESKKPVLWSAISSRF